jgi:hypothetical protein
MKRTRQKPIARETKQKPVKDVRWDLRFFIRFLRKTGEGSLKAKFDLPERELLQARVQKLGPCAESLIGIIEKSGIPEDAKWVALHNLWSVLASAYIIGSEGTISENTKVAINYLDTADMREAKDRHREPSDKRIREAIREAEKKYPPGFRGRMTAIDNDVVHKVGVSARTVSRHRKNLRTL